MHKHPDLARHPFAFLRSAVYWRYTAALFPLCTVLHVVAWGLWRGVLVSISAWGVGTLIALAQIALHHRRASAPRMTRGV